MFVFMAFNLLCLFKTKDSKTKELLTWLRFNKKVW